MTLLLLRAFVLFNFSQESALFLSFHSPESIEAAVNCEVKPQPPTRTITLIPYNPKKPRLWYAPVGTFAAPNGALIWYQRVDPDEEYLNQRVLCLGVWKDNQWIMPPFTQNSPPWGGPNNIVLKRSAKRPTWGGFNVFQIFWVEDHFEMLYWDQPENGEAGILHITSPDGKNWSSPPPQALITELNDAFTVLRKENEYLMFQTGLEDWPNKPFPDNLPGKRRIITIRRSRDLVNWSERTPLLRPDNEDPPETEFYLFKAFQYINTNTYVGLLMKYYADPTLPNQHSQKIKTEVLLSTEGVIWRRPFRNVDFGIWSYADPFIYENQWLLPAGQRNALVLHSFSRNRLIGVETKDNTKEASFVTPPFTMPIEDLALDADAREGWIEIDLLDGTGFPATNTPPCRMEHMDVVEYRLTWGGDASSAFPIPEGRLQFRMKNARIFSIKTLKANP